MKRVVCTLLLVLTGWLGAGWLGAGLALGAGPAGRALDVSAFDGSISVSGWLDYVEQTQHLYTIEDMLADQGAGDIPWISNHSASPGFGFDANTFWFRLVVTDPGPAARSLLLEIDNPVLDDVVFYQVDAAGHVLAQSKTGDRNPSAVRPYFHHNLVLPFSIPAGATHFLYFRVTTSGAMEFPLQMWDPTAFNERDQGKQLFFGALFGVLVVMGLYNVFVYILFRDPSLLYYSVVSISLMIFLATMHGFTAQYLWPDNDWLRENALVVIIPLCQFFSVMFSRHFLQLGLSYPRFDRLLTLLASLCLLLALSSLVLEYSILIRLNAALVVPVCLGGIALGVKRWLDGYQPARYFIIAWSAFLLAVSFYALTKFGLFPRSTLSEYAIQLGAVMEVVLFALALADRLNSKRRAYERAQAQALELQKAANERLEHNVAQRTHELRSAMVELEQANQRLQALSMQDGLTGIRNRRYFNDRLEQEWQRGLREGESVALLLIDIDYFKAFNDRFGHLAGDECLQVVAEVIEQSLTRPSDSVSRYGGEEFAVVLPHTDAQGAYHVAETVRRAVAANSVAVAAEVLNVTVSIGVAALVPALDMTPQQLLAQADQCLYEAKSGGRNRTCVAAPEPTVPSR